MGNLRALLLAGYAYTASTIDVEGSNDTIGSRVILKVCICFASFVDDITIIMSLSLSVWSCLCLAVGYLPLVLGVIVEDNKIDY